MLLVQFHQLKNNRYSLIIIGFLLFALMLLYPYFIAEASSGDVVDQENEIVEDIDEENPNEEENGNGEEWDNEDVENNLDEENDDLDEGNNLDEESEESDIEDEVLDQEENLEDEENNNDQQEQQNLNICEWMFLAPSSWAIVWRNIEIAWDINQFCVDREVNVELLDHNAQWIMLGTWMLSDTWWTWDSSVLMSTWMYHITWLHLSGSVFTGLNQSGEVFTWVYESDVEYLVYTWSYSGEYNDYDTGYVLRISSEDVVLFLSDEFTIDNRSPVIDDFELEFDRIHSGYVWSNSNMMISFVSDRDIDSLSVELLWKFLTWELVSESGYEYVYKIAFDNLNNTWAVSWTVYFYDEIWNEAEMNFDSEVLFDNRLPRLFAFEISNLSGEVMFSWMTNENVIYDMQYAYSNSWSFAYTSAVYSTSHNHVFSGMEYDSYVDFELSSYNVLWNVRNISWTISISETGYLLLELYGNQVAMMPMAVEAVVYAEILQREIEKFQACRDALSIREQNLEIWSRNVTLRIPVMDQDRVRRTVSTFMLLMMNRAKDIDVSDEEMKELINRMNNFFVIIKLLDDDGWTCQQNMSNYYIGQFEQIVNQVGLF